MGNLEATVVAREMQDCIHLHTINTHTHTCARQCVGAKRPFHPSLQGSTRSVGQLGGGYRGMGQDRKCEGFAEKGLCGHSGPGRRGALIPVAEKVWGSEMGI